MGRETKILLGLLGMLAFVFLGALMARLFVARPPVGLGVDIHSNVAVADPEAIVEPPALGRPDRSAFAAAASSDTDAVEPPGPDPVAAGFVGPGPVADAPAVVPASFEEPAEVPRPAAALDREIRPGTNCTVVEGDAWWSLAEAAYGDGRWYRCLYAWNRAIDPAVSLRPGTNLVLPTVDELAAAYPGLVPGRSAPGSGR